MSELRANTITASDGSSPVTLTKQSAAKAWNCFDGYASMTLRDSFNTASLVDTAVGNFSTNFVNSLVNDDFAASGTADDTTTGNLRFVGGSNANLAKTSSRYGFRCQNYSGSFADADGIMIVAHGDLA